MYFGSAIEALVERISWSKALEPDYPELDEANLTGESGRNFQSFHRLVTIENIYDAVPEVEMDDDEFNAFLSQLRGQAVLAILPEIMDKNIKYENSTDYTDMIISNAVLFDDAIGFKVAMSVLELLVATKRSNLAERNVKLAVPALKLEINGFKNENGILVATGIRQELANAVKIATNKLFPKEIIVTSEQIW